MTFLLNPYVLGTIFLCFVAGYLVHWGDVHGNNASKIASIERNLVTTRAKLEALEAL